MNGAKRSIATIDPATQSSRQKRGSPQRSRVLRFETVHPGLDTPIRVQKGMMTSNSCWP